MPEGTLPTDPNAAYDALLKNELDTVTSNAFPVIRDIIQKYSNKAPHALTAQFFGYRAKEDVTALPGGFLVSPSQNVLHNAAGLIYNRPGYSLDGQAAMNPNVIDGITCHHDWFNPANGATGVTEQHLRVHNGAMEYRYVSPSGTVSWLPLLTQGTSGIFNGTDTFFRYAEYYDTTEELEELLMVNGDSSVYKWSGAQASFAAATSSALSMTPGSPNPQVICIMGKAGLVSTFSISTTSSNISVMSGTFNGTPCGFIILNSQPLSTDTITLTINGIPLTINFTAYYLQPLSYQPTAPDTIRLGVNYTFINYVGSYPNASSPNVVITADNLLQYLTNPTTQSPNAAWGYTNSSNPTLLNNMTFSNVTTFLSGSTTTVGNTVSPSSPANSTGVLTFAMVNNPANGDTATFDINGQSINVQFVNTIGATAGNVLIGAAASNTLTNLLGLLQAPTTTNSTQVAFSANNALIIGIWSYGVSTGITLQGTKTWAQMGFMTQTGGRGVVINGQVFNYTGGETTLTITGVAPNPTAQTIAVGTPIVQSVLNYSNTSGGQGGNNFTGLPAGFGANLIACKNNQVYYGNTTSNTFYFSKTNNFLDVTCSTPRIPADGSGSSGLQVDAPVTAFIAQEGVMYVSAGHNWLYTVTLGPQQVQSVTSSGTTVATTYEPVTLQPLKISPGQAAQSQEAMIKVKNSVFLATFEPALDNLGRIADNLALPEAMTLTDSIKNDFLNYDLTGMQGVYLRYFLFITLPAEQKVLVYNFALGWWEPPQVFAFSRFSIINGELYAHSSVVPETYRVYIDNPLDENVRYDDNGNPINAIAYLSYQNFGLRDAKKQFPEVLYEGYIAGNTTLLCGVKYDLGGFNGVQTFSLAGNVASNLFYTYADNSLGKVPLGKNPIGSITDSLSNTPKFRHVFTTVNIDFYECQFFFQTNDIDQQWQLLCYAPLIQLSDSGLNEIKT